MAPPTMATHRVVGVSGVAAVALVLFGTRWGSYLGYNPIFLTDVLILAAAGYWAATYVSARNETNRGRANTPGLPLALFLAYVVARSMVGPSVLTMDWVRDVIPFLYAGLAFLSAATYAQAGPEGRRKTMRLLWVALIGHLLWVLVVTLGDLDPTNFPNLPGSPVTLFTLRPDVDMAVLAMTAALCLRRIILYRRKTLPLVGLAACLAAVTGFESRAGLIAVVVAMGLSYVLTLAAHPNRSRQQNWIAVAPLMLLLVVGGLPQTEPGQRLLATVGVVEAEAESQRGALGTANAREGAWGQVIEWTSEDTTRLVVGVGFGPDFMMDSGAERDLGTEGVRSPHNWFVGVYARLGIFGTALVTLVLAYALTHLWRIRRAVGSVELLTLAATGLVALLLVGALGVVLESPFGAVPFWWFLGIIMSERRLQVVRQKPQQIPDQLVTI